MVLSRNAVTPCPTKDIQIHETTHPGLGRRALPIPIDESSFFLDIAITSDGMPQLHASDGELLGNWTGSGLDLLSQPLLGRVGAQLEVPLLAEPLERALQVSTIYFVATTESTQSDVLKPRAN